MNALMQWISNTCLGMMLVCAAGAAWADSPARVRIPAGEFTMGLDQSALHGPAHRVRLSAFYLAAHEVTNAEYERFQPGHRRGARSACDACPVTRVSWHEAEAYCRSTGGRLPTEAEWERAARGPDEFPFSFGTEPDPARGHFAREFQTGAVAAGTFSPNGFGLHHMSGNVWEWTADWFAPYAGGAGDNPRGPATGVRKSVRGGGWYQPAYFIHTARRFALDPASHLNALGFRCAWDSGKD